jgi:hypothetical protein
MDYDERLRAACMVVKRRKGTCGRIKETVQCVKTKRSWPSVADALASEEFAARSSSADGDACLQRLRDDLSYERARAAKAEADAHFMRAFISFCMGGSLNNMLYMQSMYAAFCALMMNR